MQWCHQIRHDIASKLDALAASIINNNYNYYLTDDVTQVSFDMPSLLCSTRIMSMFCDCIDSWRCVCNQNLAKCVEFTFILHYFHLFICKRIHRLSYIAIKDGSQTDKWPNTIFGYELCVCVCFVARSYVLCLFGTVRRVENSILISNSFP